jgi:hypothetical protein
MKRITLFLSLIAMLGAILAVGCSSGETQATEKEEPAVIESVDGSEFNTVRLTERAAQRLGIETSSVQEETIAGETRLVVPYSAVLYGLHGETWVYVNGEPLAYRRAAIQVDHIDGEKAILHEGPPVGTHVVTVGVAELFGADTGVGK